ncbi:hypothetical protein FRC18_002883 [Serendipita sp. 400]|nr:hypothetical protein FRC18_002883 [Serendipita sp. 400]
MYLPGDSPREDQTRSLSPAYDTPSSMDIFHTDVDSEAFKSHVGADAAMAEQEGCVGPASGPSVFRDYHRVTIRTSASRPALRSTDSGPDGPLSIGNATLDVAAAVDSPSSSLVTPSRREGSERDEATRVTSPVSGTTTYARHPNSLSRLMGEPGGIPFAGGFATEGNISTPGPTTTSSSSNSSHHNDSVAFEPVLSPRAASLSLAMQSTATATAAAPTRVTAIVESAPEQTMMGKKKMKSTGRRSNISRTSLEQPSPPIITTPPTTTTTIFDILSSPIARSATPTVVTTSSPTTVITNITDHKTTTDSSLLLFTDATFSPSPSYKSTPLRPASTGVIRTPRAARETRNRTDLLSQSARRFHGNRSLTAFSLSPPFPSSLGLLPPLPRSRFRSNTTDEKDTSRMDSYFWTTASATTTDTNAEPSVATAVPLSMTPPSFLSDDDFRLQLDAVAGHQHHRRVSSAFTGYSSPAQTATGLTSASFDNGILGAATPVSPVAAGFRSSNVVDALKNRGQNSQQKQSQQQQQQHHHHAIQEQQQLLHRRPTHHSQSSVQRSYDQADSFASFPSPLDSFATALFDMSSAQQQQQQHYQQHGQLTAVVAPYGYTPSPPLATTTTTTVASTSNMNGSLSYRSPNMPQRRSTMTVHHHQPYPPPPTLAGTTSVVARSPYLEPSFNQEDLIIPRPFEGMPIYEDANKDDYSQYPLPQQFDSNYALNIRAMMQMNDAAQHGFQVGGQFRPSPPSPFVPSSPSEGHSEDQRGAYSPSLQPLSRHHVQPQSLQRPTQSRARSQTHYIAASAHRTSVSPMVPQQSSLPPPALPHPQTGLFTPLVTSSVIPPSTTPAATTTTGRFPGQRVDSDIVLIASSFSGNDEASRKRRAILDYILRSDCVLL